MGSHCESRCACCVARYGGGAAAEEEQLPGATLGIGAQAQVWLRTCGKLLQVPRFRNGVIAQFFYVGSQIGVWSYLIQYMQANVADTSEKDAADHVFYSLLMLTLGRAASTVLLKVIADVELMLIFGVINVVLCGVGIVSRTIIAGIWVAFFRECQQRSCGQEGEEYDPEDPKPIKLSLIAFATEYTGRGRHVLGRLNTTVSADDASGAGIELNLDSSNREFDRMHKGTGFPITVVGTAVWKDLAPQPDRLVGAVDTTGAKVTLIEEESKLPRYRWHLGCILLKMPAISLRTGTELVVPELEISGPEPKTTLIGEETTLTVRIPNPFSTKPLTGVRLLAEGRRCVSATIRTSARTPPL